MLYVEDPGNKDLKIIKVKAKLTLKNGKAQPNPNFPNGIAALKKYVINLETMRQLVSTFVAPLESVLPSP